MVQIMQILKDRPEHFLVISGDDSLTYPMMALGADGVISVAAQAVPKTFSDMIHDALAGDMASACANHYQMLDLMEALFADGSPAGVKAALSLSGLCENELRLPLVPVNEKVFEIIRELLA
jgi:4-hydroxy-tetrahydrodipicolinate synthase